MPAPTKAIPLPIDRGESAADYLEAHGIVAHFATSMRSGDYELCLSNPHLYYLIRRLGLRPALGWSKAMNRGSWFHHLLALFNNPNRFKLYDALQTQRLAELGGTCKALGLSVEKALEITARELKDAAVARAWFEATESVPIKRKGIDKATTFQEWLRDGGWQVVGSEVQIIYMHPDYPGVPIVVQYDLLLYNPKANALWIVDGKTTSDPCIIRLATTKHEFQTQHYLVTADRHLPTLAKALDLPGDVHLAGMIHIAIWKPGIEFGQKDRDYQWVSEGKRKGIVGRIIRVSSPTSPERPYRASWYATDGDGTGSVSSVGTFEECFEALHEATGKKPEKLYSGEPSLPNFIKRLGQCYRAEGEYLGEKLNREEDPPVNWIYTSATVLQERAWLTEYWDRVQFIHSHATRPPVPSAFHRHISDLRKWGRLSEYAPFFLSEPKDWPEIIKRNNFIIAHRDDDVDVAALGDGCAIITP